MSQSDRRASDSDRAAGRRLVDDALARGRIIQADHDLRVSQLEQARTQQDVDVVTRDLGAVLVAAAAPPPPVVNYGPPQPQAPVDVPRAGAGRAIGLITTVAIAIVVVAVTAAVISSSRGTYDFATSTPSPTNDTTYAPGQPPDEGGVNLHSEEGFAELVDALRSETGATYVYSAALYPRYAVLTVPTGTGQRYQSWYWDGDTLVRQGLKATSSDDQIDLGLVDPRPMVEVLTEVRSRVDDPSIWYIRYDSPAGARPQFAAYASNDFHETSYVLQGLDGTRIYDSDQHG